MMVHRLRLALLLLLAALLWATPAAAQNAGREPARIAAATATPGTAAPEQVNLLTQTVALPVGKAKLVRLPVEVRDVLVGDSATADIVIKTPRLVYLIGRQVGSTNAFFLDADGQELLRLEIDVQIDVGSVRRTMDNLLPHSDIQITAVNSDLFLTGSVRSADISENARQIARRFVEADTNVVNMLAVIEDQQVLLQVRVAEVSRSILKELGVNLFDAVSNTFTTLTSTDLALRVGSTNPFADTPFLNSALAYSPSSGDTLTVVINALERNGLIKTLAEPNLTTVSGEPATFLAGGEFPIPVQADLGRVTVEMKPFGVALNFTPVVLNSGRISLRIFTEVSGLTDDGAITLNNIQVPALTVRRAETTVELPTGGSLMIAGLLQDDERATIRGVPGVKDIPVLGPLFRNNTLDQTETELVVAVTCFLVRPTDPDRLQLPTANIGSPSDYELYFLGRLQTIYTQDTPQPDTASLKGPVGYIVE